MKIIFFNKDTKEPVSQERDIFLSEGGTVYENTYHGTESQSAYVSLHDFLVERPELGWKVVYMSP